MLVHCLPIASMASKPNKLVPVFKTMTSLFMSLWRLYARMKLTGI